MDIGQRYIRTLLQSDDISNNLIRLAVAYNSGPNALDRGRHFTNESDALMYLETMPAGETKGFVEQVLANYWNYRQRLGEDTASLSDMAAGKWPMYVPKPTLVADARLISDLSLNGSRAIAFAFSSPSGRGQVSLSCSGLRETG